MMEGIGQLVNRNPAIVRWGRGMNETFMVEVGDTRFLLTVRDGRLDKVEKARSRCARGASRYAQAANRGKVLAKDPAPGWHDLFAPPRRGE